MPINIENFRRPMTDGALALSPLPPLTSEICNSAEGWVAPKAGERAKQIQSSGLKLVDQSLADYERTGDYTREAARASYNAFMRMAIVSGEGNVLNVSGATRLPEGVNSHFLLESIGRKTIGADVQSVRYGRISLMVTDVDELDYAQLFTNFTNATKEVNSDNFPENEAKVLNTLQDKRRIELLAEVNRSRGVVERTVEPNIAAISNESKNKEYFLWTGRRNGEKIEGINPDGNWQDQAELSKYAPDLVTKGLMAHELDLLLSAKEGKIRIIFIGDNEAYVKRCCVSASNEQHFVDNFVTTPQIMDMDSDALPMVYGDEVVVRYGDKEFYSTKDYCQACHVKKTNKGKCDCNK